MLLGKRCEEELSMLQVEMINVLAYWKNRLEQLTTYLDDCVSLQSESNLLIRGTYSCLKCLYLEAEMSHTKAQLAYHKICDVDPKVESTSHMDDFDDSASDTDNDTDNDNY